MYKFYNSQKNQIIGANGTLIPVDEANADYRRIKYGDEVTGDRPQTIENYAPSPDDVRSEAGRRMMALVGARDAKHLEIIISNGLRETVRLQQVLIGGGTLDAVQASRKASLEGADSAMEAIREASNVLETMDPVPDDYADDKYWRNAP